MSVIICIFDKMPKNVKNIIMKKFLIISSTILVLLACGKDEDSQKGMDIQNEGQKVVFYATTESQSSPGAPGTKVYADENLKVLWNEDDRISIFNKSTQNDQYVFTGEDGDSGGNFELEPYSGFASPTELDHIYAVYPYSSRNHISDDGTIITVNLPETQSYKEHSFGIGANTMVAVTDNNYLAFKNACGYLQLRLFGNNVTVSSVSIQGNNGEKIAGKASLTMNDNGLPVVTMDDSATETITIGCPEPVTLGTFSSEFTDFCFVIPPVTFSGGFKITVTDSHGLTYEKTTSKSLSISRNKMEMMSALRVSIPFLIVEETDVVMNQTDYLEIPYSSSGSCIITDLNVTQYNLLYSGTYKVLTSNAIAGEWVSLDENNNIVINHALVNDLLSENLDVTPYHFEFYIQLADDPSFKQKIIVDQYPNIFIDEHLSNGYAFVKGIGNETASNTILDSNTSINALYRNMGTMVQRSTVNGSTAYNNQHQYTFHITKVPEESGISIGDPRASVGTNLLSGITELNDYKPAAEDKQNVMAPVFRIASSYGKTISLTYEGAQKRCAAYQENGYPAGRWRLPTRAEIEFMTILSNYKVPVLFEPEPTAGYWASGKIFMIRNNMGDLIYIDANSVTPNNNKSYLIAGTTYNVWSRCVYDEWYWGSEQVEPLTTWGGYKTTK